jgi:hypothetical protein
MADYDEELSEIESEVDRLTRQVSGYERVGQSTPKYMATVCPGLVHAKPQPDITPFHFLTIDLYNSKHQSETYNHRKPT